MIQCKYCGRWFKNKQALKAHLKACRLKSKFIRACYTVEGYTLEATITDKAHQAIQTAEIKTANGLLGALKALKALGLVNDVIVIERPAKG